MALQLVKWGQNIPMEGVKARSLDYLPHKETAVNSLCGRFQGNIPTPYPQLPRHAQRSPMNLRLLVGGPSLDFVLRAFGHVTHVPYPSSKHVCV